MRQVGDGLPPASEAARDHVDGGGHADEDHGSLFLRVVRLRYARHGHLRQRKERPVGPKVRAENGWFRSGGNVEMGFGCGVRKPVMYLLITVWYVGIQSLVRGCILVSTRKGCCVCLRASSGLP